ncbi:unnamed protein product [Ambrosiozyma monospora]|uniref:Unnamed protein product n=1 Tax=Ambrosiozyma monospora TaxID=43982 RepID=A0ACB5T868_AMBMO|nr:unnamed protein product [Ambrosiozyma monospora]
MKSQLPPLRRKPGNIAQIDLALAQSSTRKPTVVYKSETKSPGPVINKESGSTKTITPTELSAGRQSDESAWSDGKDLIQKFGHESPSTIRQHQLAIQQQHLTHQPSVQRQQQQHQRLGQDEPQISRIVENGREFDEKFREMSTKTVIHHPTTTEFTSSATDTYNENLSMAVLCSKRGSVSHSSWRFGDIDATERSGPESPIEGPSLQYNGQRTRRASVTFQTASPEGKTVKSVKPLRTKQNHNKKTIFVVLGGCLGVIFIYCLLFTLNTLFSFNHFDNSRTIMHYLSVLDNSTRLDMVKNISLQFPDEFASLGVVPIPEPPIIHRTNLTSNTTSMTNISNSFQGVNIKYQADYELLDLMVNDKLNRSLYGVTYAPKDVIEPACGANFRSVMLDVALEPQHDIGSWCLDHI